MPALLLATLLAAADPFAALAGTYAITVEDTWDEGIAEETDRGEIVYLASVEGCEALEVHLGTAEDERLPARFRVFRCAEGLRFQQVFDDRFVQRPVSLEGAVAAAGGLGALHAALYSDTEIDAGFTTDGFAYKKRSQACLLRYPHGCLVSLPWKTTKEELRGVRRRAQ